MKSFQAIEARFSLEKLANQDVPIRYALQIVDLIDRLDPIISSEANDEDFEIERISLPDNLPIMLSAGDVKLLEPFVSFFKGG